MKSIRRIETSRLILKPVSLADAPQIQAVFPQWPVVKYMASSIPWPYPSDGALTYLRETAIPAMETGFEWHWSIRLKEMSNLLIGMISLMQKDNDNRGFWLDPDWQGRGLMTEACNAVTDFWFNDLAQPALRVPKASANVPSRAISEANGMRVIWSGERDYVSGRHRAELWEITAAEWAERIARL